MALELEHIINMDRYPIGDRDDVDGFAEACAGELESTGSLLLPEFITDQAICTLKEEALKHEELAYYCAQTHTAYLSAPDPQFAMTPPWKQTGRQQ